MTIEHIKQECRKAIDQKLWTVKKHAGEEFLVSPDGWDEGFRVDYPEAIALNINKRNTFAPAAARALLLAIEQFEDMQKGFMCSQSREALTSICAQFEQS